MCHTDGIANYINRTCEQLLQKHDGVVKVGSICTGFGTAELAGHRFNDFQKHNHGERAAQVRLNSIPQMLA